MLAASRLGLTFRVLSIAGLLVAGGGCAPPVAATPYPAQEPEPGEPPAEEAAATSPGAVRYFDREIDLQPFLEGFPYQRFMPDLEHRRVYFLRTGERYTLEVAEIDDAGRVDLSGARRVGNEDWSKRSLWSVHHHDASKSLWLHADASNDETMNLWRMPLAGGVPEQITRADYVYSYGFDEAETRVAYLARSGTRAPYSTCLRVVDVVGERAGTDIEILCDGDGLSFTWGTPRFSPDGRTVFFNAQADDDRRKVQLVAADLRKRKLAVITDRRRERSSPSTLEGWFGGDELLYTSNEDGYRNLYAYSLAKRRHRQITRFREDISGAALTDSGVFLAHGTPAGTTLELIDPRSGKSLARGGVPGQVSVLDGHGRNAMWTHRAPDVVFEANLSEAVRGAAGKMEFANKRLIALTPSLADQVVQCEATAVQIPTFDRELHAFILEPRNPVPEAQRLAMVRSFYGGGNTYTRYDHVMCAAGVTIVSASVRGSSGFGKEFSALNDGDLGGDEIVDLFHVARWLEARSALPADRIGVYGRSHGGYATMRAMTFEPETNGRNDSYPFGFGLAEAGFSDVEAFHRATNIPDWVVLEAGDPAVPAELDQIRDRSPIHDVERLSAPIFLLHGSNDWRVPVEGSRAFVSKAKAADKSVTYFEVEGQGHRVEGLDRLVGAYQARFDFLMTISGG